MVNRYIIMKQQGNSLGHQPPHPPASSSSSESLAPKSALGPETRSTPLRIPLSERVRRILSNDKSSTEAHRYYELLLDVVVVSLTLGWRLLVLLPLWVLHSLHTLATCALFRAQIKRRIAKLNLLMVKTDPTAWQVIKNVGGFKGFSSRFWVLRGFRNH